MRHLFGYIVTRFLLGDPDGLHHAHPRVRGAARSCPAIPSPSMLGGHAPEKVIEQKKEELGLDKPIAVAVRRVPRQLARLDLGESMIFKQKVSEPIIDKLPATLELTLFGLLAASASASPSAPCAARRRRSGRDFGIRLYANVVYCIPVFWLGLMLQLVFGVCLGWFPDLRPHRPACRSPRRSRWTRLLHRRHPAGRELRRLRRRAVAPRASRVHPRHRAVGHLRPPDPREHARRAEERLHPCGPARGIPERRVVYNHGLRNALIPIVTMLGLQFSLLLAGAILTETHLLVAGHGEAPPGADLPAGLPHHPGGHRGLRPLVSVISPRRGSRCTRPSTRG